MSIRRQNEATKSSVVRSVWQKDVGSFNQGHNFMIILYFRLVCRLKQKNWAPASFDVKDREACKGEEDKSFQRSESIDGHASK